MFETEYVCEVCDHEWTEENEHRGESSWCPKCGRAASVLSTECQHKNIKYLGSNRHGDYAVCKDCGEEFN